MEYLLIFAVIITTAVAMSLWSMKPLLKEITNRQKSSIKKKGNIPKIQIINTELEVKKSLQEAITALKTEQIPIIVYEKIFLPQNTTHIIYSDYSQSVWQEQNSTTFEIIELSNEEKINECLAEQNIITYKEKCFYHSRRYICLKDNNQEYDQNKNNKWQAFIEQTHTPYTEKVDQTQLQKILE